MLTLIRKSKPLGKCLVCFGWNKNLSSSSYGWKECYWNTNKDWYLYAQDKIINLPTILKLYLDDYICMYVCMSMYVCLCMYVWKYVHDQTYPWCKPMKTPPLWFLDDKPYDARNLQTINFTYCMQLIILLRIAFKKKKILLRTSMKKKTLKFENWHNNKLLYVYLKKCYKILLLCFSFIN